MKFLCVITCMDGRIQKPVLNYLEKKFPGYYPDTVTEPGPVKILSNDAYSLLLPSVMQRVEISVNKHGAKQIFIVAHPDCAGNPVEKQTQIDQLQQAKKRLQSFYPGLDVHALWVEENNKVEEV